MNVLQMDILQKHTIHIISRIEYRRHLSIGWKCILPNIFNDALTLHIRLHNYNMKQCTNNDMSYYKTNTRQSILGCIGSKMWNTTRTYEESW